MYRVLVVDDELWIREGLKAKLRKSPLELSVIDEAPSGAEALQLIENEPYDIVICDIRMQDMDGLRLCSILSQRYPLIKKIIISGYNEFDYAAKAMKDGVLAYLLKPIGSYELTNALKICIEKIKQEGNRSQDIIGKIRESVYDISENFTHYLNDPVCLKNVMSAYSGACQKFGCCHLYLGTKVELTSSVIISTIISSFEGFLYCKNILIIKGDMHDYSILYLLSDNEDSVLFNQKITDIISNMKKRFLSQSLFEIVLGISNFETVPLKCVQSARLALKHKLFFPESDTITQQMIEPYSENFVLSRHLLTSYQYFLGSGKYHEFSDVLNTILSQVKEINISYASLADLYSMLADIIIRYIGSSYEKAEKENDHYVKPLWLYNSIEDMFNGIRDLSLMKINATISQYDNDGLSFERLYRQKLQ